MPASAADHALAARLQAANFAAFVKPQVMASKFGKLLLNLGNISGAAFGPGVDDQALRKALTALKPLDDKDDAALTQNWGENIKRGAVPASDADYDAVRKLRARADIPEEGNF